MSANHNVQISDVTTTLVDGTGVFDVLMRSIDSHLDKQYISGRIKGSDYATVYLGALQTVLQQSIAFVLAEQKAEKELDLLDEQILASTNDRAIKSAQSAKDLALKEKDLALKDEQILASTNDRGIKTAQSAEQIAASQANTATKQGIAEKQEAVYEKQAQGFDRDYKYKITKALLDIRTTGLTQGIAGITTASGNNILNQLVLDSGFTSPTTFLTDVV